MKKSFKKVTAAFVSIVLLMQMFVFVLPFSGDSSPVKAEASSVQLEDRTIYSFEDINYSFENYYALICLNQYYHVFGRNDRAYQLYLNEKNTPVGYISGGVCYGMCTTSLLLNNSNRSNIAPSDFKITFFGPSAKKVKDIKKWYANWDHYILDNTFSFDSHQMSAGEFIELMQISYSSQRIVSENNSNVYYHEGKFNSSLRNIINSLSKYNPIIIHVGNASNRREDCVAHELFPYFFEEINDHEARIYVYDCNHPDDAKRFIRLWKSQNKTGGYTTDYDNWYYNGGAWEYGSSLLGSHRDSYITYNDLSSVLHCWDNMGNLWVYRDSLLLAVSVGSVTIKSKNTNKYAKIEDGCLVDYTIEDLLEITEIGNTNSTSEDCVVKLYLPYDEYEVENTGDSNAQICFSAINSSVTASIPEDSVATVSVSDETDNSISVDLPENADSSEVDVTFSYDDTADEFIDKLNFTGDASGESVTVAMTDGGIVAEGFDSINLTAQQDEYKGDADVSTTRGENSALLISADGIEENKQLVVLEDSNSTGTYNNELASDSMAVVVDSVSIDQESITLDKGQSTRLGATLSPANHTDNPAVHWISSDENIVTVSETGVITAISGGEAKIVCYTDDMLIQDSCIVKVEEKAAGITLDSTSIYMDCGEINTLSAEISPGTATSVVNYSSSNESVATVDRYSGDIKAVGEGFATITATAGEVTAQCNVTVYASLYQNGERTVSFPDALVDAVASAMFSFSGSVNISSYNIPLTKLHCLETVIKEKYPCEYVAAERDISSYDYYTDDSVLTNLYFQNGPVSNASKYNERLNTLRTVSHSVISSVEGESVFGKILAVHDFLTFNGQYDTSRTNRNAYSLIVDGTGICNSYADAFKMFMDLLNIPCIKIDSDNMDHAWNMVEIDGKWYHLDATWDDPTPDMGSEISYKYFLLNDEEMSADHYDWTDCATSNFAVYSNMPRNSSLRQKYCNGRWYYIDSNNLFSVSVFGEDKQQVLFCPQGFFNVYKKYIIYSIDATIHCYDTNKGYDFTIYTLLENETNNILNNSGLNSIEIDNDGILTYTYISNSSNVQNGESQLNLESLISAIEQDVEHNLSNPIVRSSKDFYTEGEIVTIYWNSIASSTSYTVNIENEFGESIILENVGKSLSYSASLPSDVYTFYVTASNAVSSSQGVLKNIKVAKNIGDSFYAYISNVKTGLYIGYERWADGYSKAMVIDEFMEDPYQIWKFDFMDNGCYKISTLVDEYKLSLGGVFHLDSNGNRIGEVEFTEDTTINLQGPESIFVYEPAEYFYIVGSDDRYRIGSNILDRNLALEEYHIVYDGTTYDGLTVGLADPNTSEEQLLNIVKLNSLNYTIKYDDNGGYGGPGEQVASYNEVAKLSSIIPKRRGYDFYGWQVDRTGRTYTAGDIDYYEQSPATLKAVWFENGEELNPPVIRLSGASRYDTAISISDKGWTSADTVVLANGLNYADALAGVPLAYKLNAPILLTAGKVLEDNVAVQIEKLGASKVVLLGGAGAVSKTIENKLRNDGYEVERVAGLTRYETAVEISRAIAPTPDTAFVVTGTGYADALSISPYAAMKGYPIVYANPQTGLTKETVEYLNSASKIYIIGGTGAVGKNSVTQLGNKDIERIAGLNRFLTSYEIAQKFTSEFGDCVMFATGMNFPDALAGGVLGAKLGAPLLLTHLDGAIDEIKNFVLNKNPSKIYILGGKGVVPDSIVNKIFE